MALIVGLTSHHRRLQRKMPPENGNHCSTKSSNHFCNKIGQTPPHAPAAKNLPFRPRTTAKSVTDLTSEAWYRFPHCNGRDPIGGSDGYRHRKTAIRFCARRRNARMAARGPCAAARQERSDRDSAALT